MPQTFPNVPALSCNALYLSVVLHIKKVHLAHFFDIETGCLVPPPRLLTNRCAFLWGGPARYVQFKIALVSFFFPFCITLSLRRRRRWVQYNKKPRRWWAWGLEFNRGDAPPIAFTGGFFSLPIYRSGNRIDSILCKSPVLLYLKE